MVTFVCPAVVWSTNVENVSNPLKRPITPHKTIMKLN